MVLLQGPVGWRFLMSEVQGYLAHEQGTTSTPVWYMLGHIPPIMMGERNLRRTPSGCALLRGEVAAEQACATFNNN